MKLYIKSLASACLLLGAGAFVSSCSETDVYNVDFAAIPLASDYADAIEITVDQETNNATFSFNGKGVYPIWIIDGKSYSTSHLFTRFYRKAGTYQVELKVGNANGMSQGTIVKEFTINKTIMSGFGGYVYDSPFNLWTSATKKDPTFFYAPGWGQIADPSYSFDGEAYTVTLPEATTDQWQAQMHIATDISLNEGESFDGSFIFTSSKDINRVTLKIHPNGDDDDTHSFFCNQTIKLTAGEPATFWFSDLTAAVPMNDLVFTLDFGGNQAGTEITIENFVLKNHANDDGTVLPDLPTVPEPTWVDENSADNLWHSATFTNSYYYAPGWSPIADPIMTANGNSYSFSLPSATFETWQAQLSFNTDIAIPDPNIAYDFKIELESNVDLNGVTLKFVQPNEVDENGEEVKHENNFLFAEQVNLTAGLKQTFWFAGVKMAQGTASPSMNFIIDCGGNPANTEITASGIILQVHHD